MHFRAVGVFYSLLVFLLTHRSLVRAQVEAPNLKNINANHREQKQLLWSNRQDESERGRRYP